MTAATAPVLPHDLVAERALLGAVLVDNAAFPEAAAVVTEHTFFRVAHGQVWCAIASLCEAGRAADLVTVKTEMERQGTLEDAGGPAYLASLIDGVPRSMNVAHYAGIVQTKAALREIVRIGDRLQRAAHEGAEEPVSLLDELEVQVEATRGRLLNGARGGRRVQLILANTIAIRPVRWLWDLRMALGTFGLLGGREGIGKSLIVYTLVAQVTRGTLPGAYFGTPRDVVVSITEDSMTHTAVPRLIAAGADLSRVHFIRVVNQGGGEADLVLPIDVPELTRVIREVDAVLLVLDPLLSRLDTALDSHKDAEARRALEPLAALADVTNACILGLIHVNKTSTSDPLTMLMASRAFAAVARWVLFAMTDPDDEQRRLLGLAKSNLGRTDLPTLAYQIAPVRVAQTAEGDIWTGRLHWLGEADGTIREAIQNASPAGEKTATTEATEWLADYLAAAGGEADSAEVRKAGARAGHTADHLRRARERLKLKAISVGFPRTTRWALRAQSGHQSGHPVPTPLTTATTAFTGDISNELIDCSQGTVAAVAAVERDPARGATTVATTPEATRVRL